MDYTALNLNDSTFYKRIDNIGSTTYVNIVDGSRQTVPWGSLDWISTIVGNALSFTILGGLIWLGVHYLVK